MDNIKANSIPLNLVSLNILAKNNPKKRVKIISTTLMSNNLILCIPSLGFPSISLYLHRSIYLIKLRSVHRLLRSNGGFFSVVLRNMGFWKSGFFMLLLTIKNPLFIIHFSFSKIPCWYRGKFQGLKIMVKLTIKLNSVLKILKSTFWTLKVQFNHKLRTFFRIPLFGKNIFNLCASKA
jgi:hypothetical protein